MIVRGYRKDTEGNVVLQDIFDIVECTYTGKHMGERSITATVNWASPIDFQIGDYIELQMQSLVRSTSGENGDIEHVEKFYIYTTPTIKKTARAMSHGTAFEHVVTFYPAQHELACVQMRDMGNALNADSIIYTGFDSVNFYGGAKELMDRIMEVLKDAYVDSEGNPLWSYEIADAVNEEKNTALERFPFSFSGNSVMDALLKLNDKEGINTTFFINDRKIYVGFKRPYFCRVTDGDTIDSDITTQMFSFQYGKTSHESKAINYGGLYDITKTTGKDLPITKLFAYGASRNLNRYYCSDRLAPGRYVNRLMLPSFSTDGKTDFIISEDAMQRYGMREASKQFEDIYPSLRYMTYGDLRSIKYCIKIKASGLADDDLTNPVIDIARVQCYKVVEGDNGVNTLVEAAPPDDLAIYVHAVDKIVRVVLFGGATDEEAIAKQLANDGIIPRRSLVGSDYIPGSCFLVHDDNFGDNHTSHLLQRSEWFNNADDSMFTQEEQDEIHMHQINYHDTFWLTDLYIFDSYDQKYFNRDGYSAWAYPCLNNKYTTTSGHVASDSLPVNTVIAVEPVVIEDTSLNSAGLDEQQQTFDIYLGDVGFKIDEQTDFGEMVFVIAGTVKVSFLDGMLAGREFEINGAVTDSQFSCICAYNNDGSLNEHFFEDEGYAGAEVALNAFKNGAIWRLRLNRTNLDDPDYSNLNIALPNTLINAKSGDHVVLLDIYMPDIYISAAEHRLLREAQKYLEANDNGTVNYSVNFDKVRMQQVQKYALQMREGLNVRMIDDDLDIQTENNGRYICDYRDKPLVSALPVETIERTWEYTQDYISATATIESSRLVVEVVLQYVENWLNNPIRIVQSGVNYDLGRPSRIDNNGWSEEKGGYLYMLYYSIPSGIDFTSDYSIYRNTIVKGELKQAWLSAYQAIDFTKGRYYTANFRVHDNGYFSTDSANNFRLFTVRNDSSVSYTPDYTLSCHIKEGDTYLYLSFTFFLDDTFDDSQLYYPSLLFTYDGREADLGLGLISVYEQDYAEDSEILPYADFTIDNVTIKITDSSNRSAAQPIKEITATLSEQHNATAWASLSNRVENAEKEADRNNKTAQEIANTARRHYQTLLNLRNSIFDPDGSCDQTFLQVMMLQVGADSMNYQLRNTRVGLTDEGNVAFFNCRLELNEDDNVYHFIVEDDDVLDHFVFTQGNDGSWYIPKSDFAVYALDVALNGNDTYFICIKCPKDGSDATWLCETTQHKVNEDDNYWYFNWGILTVDSGGVYTITETRGNAYMYGDNLICGKISTLAGQSYFDLTHGDFVLRDDDGVSSLSYINGKLTISGVSDLIGAFESSTKITGGLILTNVLELKNEFEDVVAGMSGVSSDNVLLWGGGDYDDAANAASDEDYNKVNGTPITTLIKKDGTGKIGVFQIEEDSVLVDSDGGVPVVITNKSVGDIGVDGESKMSSISATYGSQAVSDSGENSIDIITRMTGDSSQVIVKNVTVTFNHLEESGATNASFIELYFDYTENGTTKTKTLSFNGSLTDVVHAVSENVLTVLSTTFAVRARYRTFYESVTISFEYFFGNSNKLSKCVIANDGMVFISGLSNRFYIKPSASSLDIIADLPVVSTDADKQSLAIGQLYQDENGFVKRITGADLTST